MFLQKYDLILAKYITEELFYALSILYYFCFFIHSEKIFFKDFCDIKYYFFHFRKLHFCLWTSILQGK